MNFRELVNRRPKLAAASIIAIAVLAIGFSFQSSRGPKLSGPITQAFFSDDDGKSWFAEDINKPFPFDHNGRQAYRAYVFRCQSGDPFVGYLASFSDAGAPKGTTAAPTRSEQFGPQKIPVMQVKKPGESNWIPIDSPQGELIIDVKGPDGSRPLAVLPE